ncbi:uncharacterized protein LOC126823668 [Patella vulgata]|uniref:uncharacterized protein LOC126823668 n=1 Tax=Patella vulgata TaxID=6465 RepID=UPI00217FE5B9|nr:uncharacterized protein LOC126823668 [Patella vulgata]
MPNGLLSGLGFNNKDSSHGGPQELNLFNSMGNLFHPVQHQMPAGHSPMHPQPTQNHFNPVQFQNPPTNHFRAPHDAFAGPHNRYPGANPSFVQNENSFGVQPNHFVGFPGSQFNTPPQPHHHVFGGLPGFNQDVNPRLSTGFRESPPPQPSPKTYMPSPPSPPAIVQQPPTSNPSAMPNKPAGIAFQNPTNVPSFTQDFATSGIPVSHQTNLAPAATVQPNNPAPAAIVVQPNHQAHAATAQPDHPPPATTAQINHPSLAANPTNPSAPSQDSRNAGFEINHNRGPLAQQPMNHMRAFGPFGSHPHDTFSQQNNFLHPPMQPLHNFGPSGFMNKPVQDSASKATKNIHNFMGGFDDFNNGFHGFSSNIGRKSPSSDTRNKGSFFNNLFNFKRR